MFVIDRLMLAGYSINSMNAVAMSSNFVSLFVFIFVGIANTAEIFVGQYNGSRQYDRLAPPVWQMLYLSLASSIFFVPVAYFSDHLNTLPSYYLEDGLKYQRILMYGGMLPAIKSSLASFFIGQGKTKIVTVSMAFGALNNVVLDYLLIYGVGDVIPSMGSRGAAMATVASELLQIIILAPAFFSKKNRSIYGAFANRAFDKKLFADCFRVGGPMALCNFVTLLAWYMVLAIVNHVSKDMATVYNVGISVYIFFIFVGEGAQKAIVAICSNMIGRDDLQSIEKTRRVFVAISWFFGFMMAIPLVFFPEWILRLFDTLPDNCSLLYRDMKIVFYLITAVVTLETLVLSTWGILVAGGDTKYSAMIYQICLWVFTVLPVGVLYRLNVLNSVPLVYAMMVIWLLVTQFFMHRRYKSLKWYNKLP
jgi:MATE family multidrug resistance protein